MIKLGSDIPDGRIPVYFEIDEAYYDLPTTTDVSFNGPRESGDVDPMYDELEKGRDHIHATLKDPFSDRQDATCRAKNERHSGPK